jgi:thioredoxin reductase
LLTGYTFQSGKIQVLLQAWQTESSNIKRDRVAMIDFVDINCTRVVNLKGIFLYIINTPQKKKLYSSLSRSPTGSIRMRSKRRTSTEGYA